MGGRGSQRPTEPAYGPSNDFVNWAEGEAPGINLGSYWSNALEGEIRDNGNVEQSFEDAGDNDYAGPNGRGLENPVVASGNGGDTIGWNEPNTGHSAVVFGGHNNRLRHDNNIENISDAMSDLWGGNLTYMGYGWGDAATGTTAHLKGLISAAASHLRRQYPTCALLR